MSKGSIAVQDQNYEIPRFTNMLRAFVKNDGDQQIFAALDIAAEYVRREKLLQERQKLRSQQQHQVDGGDFMKLVLGDRQKAPKEARAAYDKFLKLTGDILGSELSSQELQQWGVVAWKCVEERSSQLADKLYGQGHPSDNTKTLRNDLQNKFGRPLDIQIHKSNDRQQTSVVPAVDRIVELVSSFRVLRGWQSRSKQFQTYKMQQLNSGVSEEIGGEWGAHLPFAAPTLFKSEEEALLTLCAALPGGVQPRSRFSNFNKGAQEGSGLDLASMYGNNSKSIQNNKQQRQQTQSTPQQTFDSDEDDDDGIKKQTSVNVNLGWLDRWVNNVTGFGGNNDDLALEICRKILSEKSLQSLGTQLMDLLGDTMFDAVQELLQLRKPLQLAIKRAILKSRAIEGEKEVSIPSFARTITVQSESQKLIKKMEKKEKKGKNRGGQNQLDTETLEDLQWINQVGFDGLLETEDDDHGASRIFLQGTEFSVGKGQRALPEGTVRKSYKDYEEVSVPPPERLPPPTADELVPITVFEQWGQLAFKGYKSLNRIQSRIFPTVSGSNENVLVCAPTGAGKTNIAMIAVLREIGLHVRHGVIQRGEFKIVYIAPMKALAAEVTQTFGRRLEALGIQVKELTGDMQLSKREIAETQMIVTTPEKWDVITRKSTDGSVSALVKLLIIDEVHLLNDDRGPVIETIVARTKRQVEASQTMIRIVGLSATLPNYRDVAQFLGVNLETGLFHFDSQYRPVPLSLSFVGVTETKIIDRAKIMNEVCYNKIVDSLRRGYQVMVFVNSRKETGATAQWLAQTAQVKGDTDQFDTRENPKYSLMMKEVSKSRNKEVVQLFASGFGIHHAGMLRHDRNLTERAFSDGLVKVLCCTATLAWGVNLPAHTVIIKGTQQYDATKGGFSDMGMLDVQQIFGRAGRPQFDSSGEATIITSHDKLAHYLGMLTQQLPIESQFRSRLADNLNAEVVLGTVSNVKEACQWLSYTYLFIRMKQNPLAYGIEWEELLRDPDLDNYREFLIKGAAEKLNKCRMSKFHGEAKTLGVTELGRVASHFYVSCETVETFNGLLKESMSMPEVFDMICQAAEFVQVKVRQEEMEELDNLEMRACQVEAKGGDTSNNTKKVNILMQTYISRMHVESFSLVADLNYVAQNAPRIARALLDLVLKNYWCPMADTMMNVCKMLERRMWTHQHPLRQFDTVLSSLVLRKLEESKLWVERLWDMDAKEIGSFIRLPGQGQTIKECTDAFPSLYLEAHVQPITRSILRIQLDIGIGFTWKDNWHGGALRWIVWVEDANNIKLYHSETWVLTKKMMQEPTHKLVFTIPIHEPIPPQYFVRIISEDWMGAETTLPVSFKSLVLPDRLQAHTELLDLDPLPTAVLQVPEFQSLYKFDFFNAIQTQAFHTLYHTDENVLLGAPTGSGKTISAELTMLRVFANYPDQKVIYIAPLKALVRERIKDWGQGLCEKLGKSIVELTGDHTPDLKALMAADIIIATPEKWDGISRNWQTRGYVKKVCLLIIDEIHLLGADRGPILEVIVSRMRYIASQTDRDVRFVGLSTALANPQDLGDWLGINEVGLFNFKPSVRPVQIVCHIQGFQGKHYCPRMATMNKPAYQAIQNHSPFKPVLIFVSSRRQTRLTALDIIGYAAADGHPQQFMHMQEDELEQVLDVVRDQHLRHTIQFGIGMHHAGLAERDREICEKLFVQHKIQVLVATSTLAWGVNTPAHLVIIKGTEYYDAPSRRYVDYPITDVLQMMGRAGRPQFDDHGVAVVMVYEAKRQFYKRFIYEPFPVESSLHDQVADHFNAEIVAGTIGSKQDSIDYITWTFFFRRLVQNPSYYDLEDVDHEEVNKYLSKMVDEALRSLESANCIAMTEDGVIESRTLGRIAAYYYLKHQTMSMFAVNFNQEMDVTDLLQVLCGVAEYDELPVRHNEDKLNTELAKELRLQVDGGSMDDPHTKTYLLLQAHLGRVALPISDYVTDTKGVLDNSLRILQAMVDISAEQGWLLTALNSVHLIQCIMQGRWPDDNPLLMLPYMTSNVLTALKKAKIEHLPVLLEMLNKRRSQTMKTLQQILGEQEAKDCAQVVDRLPVVDVKWRDVVDVVRGANEKKYVLSVILSKLRGKRPYGKNASATSYAPRFPKIKEEAWFVIVGDPKTQELLALRRISFGDRTTTKLAFPQKNGAGKQLNSVELYCLSDSYLGLDQQFTVITNKNKYQEEDDEGGDIEIQPTTDEPQHSDGMEIVVDLDEVQLPRRRQRKGVDQQSVQEEDDEEGFWDLDDKEYNDEPDCF